MNPGPYHSLTGMPALASLPKRSPKSDADRLMAETFPGWVPEDDTATRLSRLEAKLDELLAIERSRQLREDYERLTAEFRARGGR